MAETAYMLSPDKKVLLPSIHAGCRMADMADASGLKKLKSEHPGAVVVCYVNSTAEIKAESDMCVTSANALQIIDSLPEDKEIIFVPDYNLGAYCAEQTGRKLILWEGYCPTHMRITPQQVQRKKNQHPDAEVLIHPESPLQAVKLADKVMSTGAMCRYVKDASVEKFIIATESGIIHRLRKEAPGKQFIPVSEQAVCPEMKLTSLADVLEALDKEQYEITVPEEIRQKAVKPIEAMLNASKKLLRTE
jgi:quinolinate synthase